MPSKSTRATATEFVEEAFETTVDEDSRERLLETIDASVSALREQIGDDTLERMLRAGSGSYLLRASMTRDGLQPESFTQQAVIEPLLDTLGYDYATEAGGLSGGRTLVADYTVSLREHDGIDSTRLLIEAEPVNKNLDSREHGAGQVRDWLGQREFESDFGFATDGLRWMFIRYDPDSYTHTVIDEIDLAPVFLVLFENQVGREDPLGAVVSEANGERVTRLLRTFEFENFVSIAGNARQVIKRKQEEITDDFYDDYTRYVFGIVGEDERSSRSLVGDGVIAPDGATAENTRLFAVELMNRLVFIKFLEDKRVVQPDLLRTLKETYEGGVYGGSFYEEFCQRLFYDVMNAKPAERSSNIKNIDLFERVPYLNGGLFRPTIGEDSGEFGEREFDVRNSVLFDVIELLEEYSFSAKGAPTDLDPSVLGNVFEKTINYVTSDNADTNKELGAYYTPSEITRFCAEETVRPALLDRFRRTLVEKCDWPEHTVENFESVYELIEGLPGHMGTIGPLLDAVDDLRVVDPACGSGHFLTSVLEEIVSVRKALYARNESYPHEYRLKKTTVLNNIYGVDLMGPAVEIAKLRLWLSIIAELEREDLDHLDDEDLALPNIVFNLRQGNSLIGYTGFPETTDSGEYTLGSFSEDSVRERYEDIIEEIESHEQAIDTETAEYHRQRAFEKLREAREELIGDIHAEFVAAGIEGITEEKVASLDPFNWVLEFAEVYADGGFDVLVGNPPWDVLTVSRDDFFSRYDKRFRTKTPDQKDEKIEELLQDNEIASSWAEYQTRMERLQDYFTKADSYELQSPTVAGQTNTNENDLSALFLERVFQITRPDGYVAQVLPGNIFNGSATKDLRSHLINETEIQSLVEFENRGIFPLIHYQYNFGIAVFKNNGGTEWLNAIFKQMGPESLEVLTNSAAQLLEIPRRVLAEYSPEARIFPAVTNQREVDVLNKILRYPPIAQPSDPKWMAEAHRELILAYDDKYLLESEKPAGDYPVYGGSQFYQFSHDNSVFENLSSPKFWSLKEDDAPEQSARHRVRQKAFNSGSLKRSIYDQFGGEQSNQSQKAFVNELLEEHRGEPLSELDIKPDYSEYRIVFRDIARSSDERTMIASILPKGIVCLDSVRTIKPFQINLAENILSDTPLHSAFSRVFTDPELFVCLGLLNSIPFDFLIRTKVNTHIPKYKFEESQVPRLTAGDDWFEYIWRRAARLNCYGEAFAEMRDRLGGIDPATEPAERRRLQAELDAAAFHAYGLDREQTAFVLDDFHRVQNPRVMDEAYFDSVLEYYDELAETGPSP